MPQLNISKSFKLNLNIFLIPLSFMASGSLMQFMLTLFNLNIGSKQLITFQILLTITLFIVLFRLRTSRMTITIDVDFLFDLFLFIIFLVYAWHILSVYKTINIDLYNTSFLLSNINQGLIYEGLVSSSLNLEELLPKELLDSRTLFYPAGSFFTISLLSEIPNYFIDISFLDLQIYYILSLLVVLYANLYIFLLFKSPENKSLIFRTILLFTYFPMYFVASGNLAILASYTYCIVVVLLINRKKIEGISVFLHIIIVFFIHPLGLYALFLGLLYHARSDPKQLAKIILPVVSAFALIRISLSEVFTANLVNFVYSSNDYFADSRYTQPFEVSNAVKYFTSESFYVEFLKRLLIIFDVFYETPNLYLLYLIPFCLLLLYTYFNRHNLNTYLIIFVLIIISNHWKLSILWLNTLLNTLNFGNRYRFDGLRFLFWLYILYNTIPRIRDTPRLKKISAYLQNIVIPVFMCLQILNFIL